jgi:hypothetical protein
MIGGKGDTQQNKNMRLVWVPVENPLQKRGYFNISSMRRSYDACVDKLRTISANFHSKG